MVVNLLILFDVMFWMFWYRIFVDVFGNMFEMKLEFELVVYDFDVMKMIIKIKFIYNDFICILILFIDGKIMIDFLFFLFGLVL